MSSCTGKSIGSTSMMVTMYYTAVSYLPHNFGSLTCSLSTTIFSVEVQIIFLLLNEAYLPQKT